MIEIFEDTQLFYRQNTQLANSVQAAKAATKLYEPDDYPEMHVAEATSCSVEVTKSKTFEAALRLHGEHPDWRIAALNFASATNPGGGVKTGSSAQEESLCRCSTLYPSLSQEWLWREFYLKNRNAHNNLHTDACIYSPGVIICKTDTACPERMPENQWASVDVISCAAPNLRQHPSNRHNPEYGCLSEISTEELYLIHLRRAKHILHIGAANGVDALILGAFGCGAFSNDPNIVARAYRDAISDYRQYFRHIEFAVYCRVGETANYYDAFRTFLESVEEGS